MNSEIVFHDSSEFQPLRPRANSQLSSSNRPIRRPWIRKYGLLAVCILVAVLIALLVPTGENQLNPTATRMLGIFIGTILALLITDFPLSLIAALALVMMALTKSTSCKPAGVPCTFSSSFQTTLSGFADEVNWLVFAAFHLGKAVEVTRLGRRISLLLIRVFGQSLLGLGYAVFLSELALGPFVPSNTARGGGIILPIVLSIAKTLRSTPENQPRVNGGEFLILAGAHANLVAASLFPTGMAANPIVSKKAQEVLGIEFTYVRWVTGAIIPGLVALVYTPVLLFVFSLGPPVWMKRVGRYLLSFWSRLRRGDRSSNELFGTYDRLSQPAEDVEALVGEARRSSFHLQSTSAESSPTRNDQKEEYRSTAQFARLSPIHESTTVLNELGESTAAHMSSIQEQVKRELHLLGPLSFAEWQLIVVLASCLVLWLTTTWTGLDTTLIAFSAIVILLFANVIRWNEVLENKKAWDTFFWLGTLIMMATQLSELGIARSIGDGVAGLIRLAEFSPTGSAVVIGLVYFFSMYIFSSLTGHIVAFSGPFMQAGQVLGCSPWVLTGFLAYYSTLCGCLTNFSSGPIVIYFSQEYVTRSRWFVAGLLVGVSYVAIYSSIGLAWWAVIGWF